MMHLAAEQPGFLGVESAREAIGITVSYWADLESIKRWKAQAEHREAQRMGRETWYANYRVRIAGSSGHMVSIPILDVRGSQVGSRAALGDACQGRRRCRRPR